MEAREGGEKMVTHPVYNLDVAGWLKYRKHKVVDCQPFGDRPGMGVFFFETTEELLNDEAAFHSEYGRMIRGILAAMRDLKARAVRLNGNGKGK